MLTFLQVLYPLHAVEEWRSALRGLVAALTAQGHVCRTDGSGVVGHAIIGGSFYTFALVPGRNVEWIGRALAAKALTDPF